MLVVTLGWVVEFPPDVGTVLLSEATWREAEEQRHRFLNAADPVKAAGGAYANWAL